MQDHMTPLNNPSDLERALAEASRLMDTLDGAGPEGERRFEALLARIAEYHDAQIPDVRSAHLPELQDFDRRLQAYGRRWPKDLGEGRTQPWSPMLGGDVRPPGARSD